MDIKARPDDGGIPHADEHRRFLSLAARKDVFVKLVVTAATSDTTLDRVGEIVHSVDGSIPLVLQPVTPAGTFFPPPQFRMLEMQDRCLRILNDVRVIPQVHVYLGQR